MNDPNVSEPGKIIWVTIVDNDGGLFTSLFHTEAAAIDDLFDYVKQQQQGIIFPPDTDKLEAIRAYFDEDGCDDRAQISMYLHEGTHYVEHLQIY